MKELLNHIPQQGIVENILIRPKRKESPIAVESVFADSKKGLLGDHYSSLSGQRQVTLIQYEHLQAVAGMLHIERIDPLLTRRNIVVQGINLLALKDKQFLVGEVVLEFTGLCHPCSRMEENLGNGGYNAMRGHGGITSKVVKEGHISIGDKVLILKNLKNQASEVD